MRSSKLIIQSNAQKQMARSSFGRQFKTLNILSLDFFTFLEFIIHLWSSSNILVENHQYNVLLSCFKQFFWQLLVQSNHLHTHLHSIMKYVDFLKIFFQHKFIGFIDEYVFRML